MQCFPLKLAFLGEPFVYFGLDSESLAITVLWLWMRVENVSACDPTTLKVKNKADFNRADNMH